MTVGWPIVVIVELALGADLTASPTSWAWTDVSNRLYRGVSITRGYQDESSGLTAAKLSLAFKNADGRFNPFLATSPYYGLFNLDTPIRVRVDVGETVDNPVRFTGYISEMEPNWEESPEQQRMEIVASSIIRKTERSTVSRSPLTRYFLGEADDGLIAYWPCEDESGATQAAAALSTHAAMRIGTSPEFSSDSTMAGSLGLPKFPRGTSLTGRCPVNSLTAFTMHLAYRGTVTGGTNDEVWVGTISTSGTVARWEIRLDAVSIEIALFDRDGDLITTLSDTAFANNWDSNWHNMMIRVQQSGANLSVWAMQDGILNSPWTVTSRTVTSVGQVSLRCSPAHADAEPDIALGHLAVFDDMWFGYNDAADLMGGWVGESAYTRFLRLCNEESIHHITDVGAAAEQLMGPQPTGKLMDVIRDLAETDGGLVTDALDGRLLFTTRSELTDRAIDDARIWATLSIRGRDVYSPFRPVLDDQQHVTDVTASRPGGSAGRFAETSPERGIYQGSASVNPAADDELISHAAWRVHRTALTGFRYPQVSIRFRGSPDLLPLWLSANGGVAGRFLVTDQLTGSAPDPVDLICIGYTEDISITEWNLTMNTVPASWYRFGIVDDAVLGRVDTAGSELASGVDADDTSWSVATTAGPIWITTATLPAQFPFDVRIGGEVVRVTAISGASSPQTFTVTRSINGVVKSHASGASLALADPMRAGL